MTVNVLSLGWPNRMRYAAEHHVILLSLPWAISCNTAQNRSKIHVLNAQTHIISIKIVRREMTNRSNVTLRERKKNHSTKCTQWRRGCDFSSKKVIQSHHIHSAAHWKDRRWKKTIKKKKLKHKSRWNNHFDPNQRPYVFHVASKHTHTHI